MERPRPRDLIRRALLAGALLAPACAAGQGVTLPPGFTDSLVIGGLDQPIGSTFLPDGRLLFTERASGKVRLAVNDHIASTDPVVVVDSLRTADWEQGLLGVAADIAWPARPYLYVFYNMSNAAFMRLSRFTVTGDLAFTGDGGLTADPASRFDILLIPDIFPVHSGGTIRFGLDSMLYVAAGNDNLFCTSSNLSDLRGKLLRLNVAGLPPGPGGPPPYATITPADNPYVAHVAPAAHLVWHYGLRNPYTFHFDPATGQLLIADVGQDMFEEIDAPASPGRNFGWEYYEAFVRTPYQPACSEADTASFTFPAYAYAHVVSSGSAVISAGVYRPAPNAPRRFPSIYEGQYFFGDSFQQWLRRLSGSGSSWTLAPPVAGQPDSANWARMTAGPWTLTSLTFGPDGALYYMILYTVWNQPTGELRRISYSQRTGVEERAAGTLHVPSPARGTVRIAYTVVRSGPVTLDVLDARGRLVRRIGQATRDPGAYVSTWDARTEPSGIYRVRLARGEDVEERRVVVVR